MFLAQEGNEAPAHAGKRTFTVLGDDDGKVRGRRRVPARTVIAQSVEIDFQIELYLGDVVGKLGAAAHGEPPMGC